MENIVLVSERARAFGAARARDLSCTKDVAGSKPAFLQVVRGTASSLAMCARMAG